MPKKSLSSKHQVKADRVYAKGQRERARNNRMRRAHRRFFELMAGWR